MDGGDAPPAEGANGGEVGSGHGPGECDALGKAISSTLGAVMKEFDSRAESVDRSQDELSLALDRLTGELDKLLEDAPLPFIMQHATKISSIRRRVSSLNLSLKAVQRRIDNIDRILSTGVPNERVPADIVTTSSLVS